MGLFPPIADLAVEYLQSQLRLSERFIGVYSPSDLAKCQRLMYCIYTGLIKTDDKVEDVHGLFESGKKFELFIGEVLAYYLKKNPNLELTNTTQRNITQIVDDTNPQAIVQLNGKSDYLVMLRDRKDRTKSLLLEIKSIVSIRRLSEPVGDHKIQIMPYILALRPSEARIVYGERNNYLHLKEFDIAYDPDIEAWILERTKTIDTYIRKGELPPPEARICVKCRVGLLEAGKTNTKNVYCPNCKSEYDAELSEVWRMQYCPAGEYCCKYVKELSPKVG